LRAVAEARLGHAAPSGPDVGSLAKLVHELQVHQIELEMQNENLRQSLEAMELLRERFTDFFDFAPVGYLTLTEHGLIDDINLPGAAMLGVERIELWQRPFARFVASEDVDRWHRHFVGALKHEVREACELALRRVDGSIVYARVDSVRVIKAGQPPLLRVVLSDISKLRQVHFELRQAQQLAHLGSWYWEVAQEELVASEELCRMFGREVIPSFKEQNGTMFSLEAWLRLNDAINAALRNGIGFDLELPALRGDGAPFWIHVRCDALLDAGGRVVGLRGTVQDISERKQREDQLHIQALVLDQIQDHVTITDLDGVVTYVNQSASRALSQPGTRFVGQHVAAFGDHPEADATQREIVETTLTKGLWNGKVAHHPGDGPVMLFDLRTTLVKDTSGKPVAMVGIAADITARRQAEQALRQREQYQRALLDNFPFMVWLKDAQSRYLAVNEAFAKAFGWPSPDSLTGKTDFDIAPPDLAQAYRADDASVLASGRSKQVEELIETGGVRQWFQTYKSPITIDGHVIGVVGFARDISDWKRTEADLITARAAAEKANNAKSRFLAAASHDLRQPLAALSLFVGVLKQNDPPGCGELVANIQACTDNLSELLTDLLDVSKLDAGVVKPRPSDFAVDDFLSAVVSVHSADAGLKGLRLRVRSCAAVIRTDQQLLLRIVGNLLANAVRYTRKGGVLIACRRRQGKRWIEVWDTGIGIAEDKTGIIFEEFRQLGDDPEARGSGLGLAIVAKTAALLGLAIRLRSRPGRGSMFAVEMPAEHVDAAHPALATRAGARQLRIGLVEDNAMLLQALVASLGTLGHEVVAADNGALLFQRLAGQAPDIVISDYRLAAAETGFDVIAAAREAFGDTLPALIITGDTDPALIRAMAGRGIAVHYKPIQIDALQAAILQATAPEAT
jgi:hypothetical protein